MHSSSTAWFHRWTASLLFISFSQCKILNNFSWHSFHTTSCSSLSLLLNCLSMYQYFGADNIIIERCYWQPVVFSKLLPTELTGQCSFQCWKTSRAKHLKGRSGAASPLVLSLDLYACPLKPRFLKDIASSPVHLKSSWHWLYWLKLPGGGEGGGFLRFGAKPSCSSVHFFKQFGVWIPGFGHNFRVVS